MWADRETFAEPPLGGVWEVRVADGGELVDGMGIATRRASLSWRDSILIAIKGDICSMWGSGKILM